MQPPSLGIKGIADVPELTNAAVEHARWNPEIGCLVDRVRPGAPLVISFGFVDWKQLPNFDFFGRMKKFETRANLPLNRLLVRDIQSQWYHRGVPGLGAHVDEVAESLRGLVRSIRPGPVWTIGQSMGGYAAILFGMLLEAERIVAFGPLSHLDPDEATCYGDRRFLRVMKELAADRPRTGYYDLAELGLGLDYRGALHVVFGSHPGVEDGVSGNLDATHALRLSRIPNATLHPYPEGRPPHRPVAGRPSPDRRPARSSPPRRTDAGGPAVTAGRAEPSMPEDRNGSRIARSEPGTPLVVGFGIEGAWLDLAAGRAGRLDLWDRDGLGFYGGIEGLGGTIEEAAEALASLIDGLAPSRIIAVGRGVGGHAALVYGVMLGASRIVAIEPYAHLIGDVLEQYHDLRRPSELSRLPDPSVARRFEVNSLIDRRGYPGDVRVLLGTRRGNAHADAVHQNSIHAHWLGRSPRVTLHPFPESEPGLAGWLEGGGEPAAGLARFLFDEVPAAIRSPGKPGGPTSFAPANYPLLYNSRLTICKVEQGNPGNTSGEPLAYAAAGAVDPAMTRKIDDGLRRWLAENLLLDAEPDDLAANLEARGIARGETLREIELARFHPHYAGARRMMNRIKKRDWLIASYRKLNRLRRKSPKIERREKLPLDRFLRDYFSTGRPLIMTGMMEDWPALRSWSLAEIDRRPADRVEAVPVADLPGLLARLDEGRPTAASPAPRDLFEHEHRLVNRADGSLWLGLAGSVPPPFDERRNTLVAQVVGRGRVRLVPWWDTPLGGRGRAELEAAGRRPGRGVAPHAARPPGGPGIFPRAGRVAVPPRRLPGPTRVPGAGGPRPLRAAGGDRRGGAPRPRPLTGPSSRPPPSPRPTTRAAAGASRRARSGRRVLPSNGSPFAITWRIEPVVRRSAASKGSRKKLATTAQVVVLPPSAQVVVAADVGELPLRRGAGPWIRRAVVDPRREIEPRADRRRHPRLERHDRVLARGEVDPVDLAP